MSLCPLCRHSHCEIFFSTPDRQDYFLCPVCDLRFLDPTRRLDANEEKSRYLLHETDLEDVGYRRFIEPLVSSVRQFVAPGARGLDFGSGQNPVMHDCLARDYEFHRYDPYFHPDRSRLEETYDFIVCCEVAEHFYSPDAEFARFKKRLRPNGLLACMTALFHSGVDFGSWYYRRDPTHVVFYSEKTFAWITEHWKFERFKVCSNRLVLIWS